MIREALQYVAGLADLAAKPTKIDVTDPRQLTYMLGKELVPVPLPEPPRDHKARSLDDFMAMVAQHAETEPYDPCVYVCEEIVTCILDNHGHRVEKLFFHLDPSDVWESILAMDDWKSQKDFIRLLKIDLRGVIAESSLLDIIRKVTFENGSIVTSEIKKNRESLGKEINAKVQAASGEIPDEVTLGVPVYKSLGERSIYPMECSIEIDPMRGMFRIAPFADELERVQQLAVGSIIKRLSTGLPEGVPCYYGSP